MNKLPLLLALLVLSCSPKKEATNAAQDANVDPSVKQQIAGFLTDYFALNETLINDNLDAAKKAASSFSETARKFETEKLSSEQMDFYFVHSSNLKASLGNLMVSNDIEQARAELATISEEMYALVKTFHPNDTPLYVQYCPMARDNKGATWLSTTKELVNPYMGQMMLACGRTQETIN